MTMINQSCGKLNDTNDSGLANDKSLQRKWITYVAGLMDNPDDNCCHHIA